jgi:hypothetical protein
MPNSQKTYTIDQIAVAARELREAAGDEPEHFTGREVASLLSGEIEILRQRGFCNERIASLINHFGIDINLHQIEGPRHAPIDFIRDLLWGRLQRSHLKPDQMRTY